MKIGTTALKPKGMARRRRFALEWGVMQETEWPGDPDFLSSLVR
jgi:hypothetical protein